MQPALLRRRRLLDLAVEHAQHRLAVAVGQAQPTQAAQRVHVLGIGLERRLVALERAAHVAELLGHAPTGKGELRHPRRRVRRREQPLGVVEGELIAQVGGVEDVRLRRLGHHQHRHRRLGRGDARGQERPRFGDVERAHRRRGRRRRRSQLVGVGHRQRRAIGIGGARLGRRRRHRLDGERQIEQIALVVGRRGAARLRPKDRLGRGRPVGRRLVAHGGAGLDDDVVVEVVVDRGRRRRRDRLLDGGAELHLHLEIVGRRRRLARLLRRRRRRRRRHGEAPRRRAEAARRQLGARLGQGRRLEAARRRRRRQVLLDLVGVGEQVVDLADHGHTRRLLAKLVRRRRQRRRLVRRRGRRGRDRLFDGLRSDGGGVGQQLLELVGGGDARRAAEVGLAVERAGFDDLLGVELQPALDGRSGGRGQARPLRLGAEQAAERLPRLLGQLHVPVEQVHERIFFGVAGHTLERRRRLERRRLVVADVHALRRQEALARRALGGGDGGRRRDRHRPGGRLLHRLLDGLGDRLLDRLGLDGLALGAGAGQRQVRVPLVDGGGPVVELRVGLAAAFAFLGHQPFNPMSRRNTRTEPTAGRMRSCRDRCRRTR